MDEKQIANIKDQIAADLMEMDVCDMTNQDGRNRFDELAKRVYSNVYRVKIFAAQRLQVVFDKCVDDYFLSIETHAKSYDALLSRRADSYDEDDIQRRTKFQRYETMKNNEFKNKVCKAFNQVIVEEEILTSQQQKELKDAQDQLRGIQPEPILPTQQQAPVQTPVYYVPMNQEPMPQRPVGYGNPQQSQQLPRVNLCLYCRDNDLCDRQDRTVFKCNIFKPSYNSKGELLDI